MTTPTSFKTNIATPTGKPLAEWFSLNPRPAADRAAIAADIGTVISAVVPVLCVCCDAPAAHALGDWDVCEEHYEALSGPEGGEELIWP